MNTHIGLAVGIGKCWTYNSGIECLRVYLVQTLSLLYNYSFWSLTGILNDNDKAAEQFIHCLIWESPKMAANKSYHCNFSQAILQ